MIDLTNTKEKLIKAIELKGYTKTQATLQSLRETKQISEFEYNYTANILATLK